MKLYVSFEDKSALNQDMDDYRKHILDFIIAQRPGDDVIPEAGHTERDGDATTLCRGASKDWRVSREDLAKTNLAHRPLQYSWAKEEAPVMVIDSDGTDPGEILDYVEEVMGGREMLQDSIQIGGLEHWLQYFSGPDPRYTGKFGIVVQTPNLEGADFDGFSHPLSDKQEERGNSNTKLAFIAKAPTRLGYPRPKSRLSSKILSKFLHGMDGARKLFDLLKQADAISVPDPNPFVEYVNSPRVGTREMASSCYLSKTDRNKNRRSFSSLLNKTATDYGRLHLEFRMFSSP